MGRVSEVAIVWQSNDTTVKYYKDVIIWGNKKRDIYHTVNNRDSYDTLYIHNHFTHSCPKCETPYPVPSHLDYFVCPICNAEYRFVGALHPEPAGKTREEVDQMVKNQYGNNPKVSSVSE